MVAEEWLWNGGCSVMVVEWFISIIILVLIFFLYLGEELTSSVVVCGQVPGTPAVARPLEFLLWPGLRDICYGSVGSCG